MFHPKKCSKYVFLNAFLMFHEESFFFCRNRKVFTSILLLKHIIPHKQMVYNINYRRKQDFLFELRNISYLKFSSASGNFFSVAFILHTFENPWFLFPFFPSFYRSDDKNLICTIQRLLVMKIYIHFSSLYVVSIQHKFAGLATQHINF